MMKRGDIFWANIAPRSGSEQQGRRPVIVISHDAFNQVQNWRSIIVIPISSEYSAILLNELFGIPIELVQDFLLDVDIQVDLDRLIGGRDLDAAAKRHRPDHHHPAPNADPRPPCSIFPHRHRTGSLSGG